MSANTNNNVPVLETQHLVKRFGGLTATNDVNFTLASNGRLHAIIGPNGAGKTTFFNLISGRLKPTSGKILFKGEDITGYSTHRIARLGISRTLQIKSVFDALSVEDNIWIAAQAKMAGWHPLRSARHFPDTQRRVDKVIEEVGLQEIAKRVLWRRCAAGNGHRAGQRSRTSTVGRAHMWNESEGNATHSRENRRTIEACERHIDRTRYGSCVRRSR